MQKICIKGSGRLGFKKFKKRGCNYDNRKVKWLWSGVCGERMPIQMKGVKTMSEREKEKDSYTAVRTSAGFGDGYKADEGKHIAYIRVSTKDQSFQRQLAIFEDRGIRIDKIYAEKISGKSTRRPKLQEMLESLEPNDTVYVTELARLARSMIDLHEIAKSIMDQGAKLQSLKESVDLTSPTGIFTFNVLSAVAEFERALIKERQAEGIAAAIANGVQFGTEKKYLRLKSQEDKVMTDYLRGNITQAEAVKIYGGTQDGFYYRYKKWCQDNFHMPARDVKKMWSKEEEVALQSYNEKFWDDRIGVDSGNDASGER